MRKIENMDPLNLAQDRLYTRLYSNTSDQLWAGLKTGLNFKRNLRIQTEKV